MNGSDVLYNGAFLQLVRRAQRESSAQSAEERRVDGRADGHNDSVAVCQPIRDQLVHEQRHGTASKIADSQGIARAKLQPIDGSRDVPCAAHESGDISCKRVEGGTVGRGRLHGDLLQTDGGTGGDEAGL